MDRSLTDDLEHFRSHFGSLRAHCQGSLLDQKLAASDSLVIDNHQHGCLNILFLYLLTTSSEEDLAVWKRIRQLWSLTGTAAVYFNYHFHSCWNLSPQFIELLQEQGKWKFLAFLAQEKEHYRSIRPLFSDSAWTQLQKKIQGVILPPVQKSGTLFSP